jgi:hypothetical protein
MDDDLQHPPEEIPRLLARLFEPEDIGALRKQMREFVASASRRSRFHRRSRL